MTSIQRKSVLVTGATGFVGSHLIPALHQENWQITAALRNPNNLKTDLPLTPIQVGSINGETNWQQALHNIDTVIHLAARAHQLHDASPDPEADFLRVNTAGTANLAKQCINAGIKHFVFISSIGAMTSLSKERLSEESPCTPDTPYGRSKLQAEQALIQLAHNTPMTWTILRPTLVYGAGNPGNMERLIKLINSGLPIPLGSIRNQRSFIYVGNLVDIILRTLTDTNAENQIFLCSDGQDLSTPELIRHIAQCGNQSLKLFPFPINLLRLGGKLGDLVQSSSGRSFSLNSESLERLIGSLSVDIYKLHSHLNWSAPYSLKKGLKTLFN